MAEKEVADGSTKKYKLLKPLHYKGELIDPGVTKNAEVELYVDQAESLKKMGIIG